MGFYFGSISSSGTAPKDGKGATTVKDDADKDKK
jgi:hypothetical protein